LLGFVLGLLRTMGNEKNEKGRNLKMSSGKKKCPR
jgi:hypothetical protein